MLDIWSHRCGYGGVCRVIVNNRWALPGATYCLKHAKLEALKEKDDD